MSVWRNLLRTVLPFLFKEAEVAATAAVEKKDIGGAVQDSLSKVKPEDVQPVVDAAQAVADKTVKSVVGK